MTFPPMPTWESAHPVIVHLPLGALPVAALLAFCALFSVKSRRAWSGAAFLALAFGTLGAFLAVASGDAAEHAAVIPESVYPIFSRHEHMGKFTQNLFIGATACYALVVLAAIFLNDRCKRAIWIAAHAVFLAFFAYAFVNLANTGHLGGRLVHEFGIRAPIAGSMDPASRARDKND